MRRETKIGLLTIITLALGIWGFKYLKGVNMLEASTILYAKYSNIGELRLSTPVKYNGFQVGLVSDIYPDDNSLSQIVVEFNINEGISIHKDATFQITSTSVMGDVVVNVLDNPPCAAAECAASQEYVKGTMRGVFGSMLGVDDLKSYMDVINDELKKLFDTITNEVEEGGKISATLNDFSSSMANLKSLTGRLDNLLAKSSGSIDGTLANLKSLTDTLNTASGDIKNLVANAEGFTEDLKKADLSGTINEAKSTFTKLQSTLDGADKLFGEFNDLAKKMKDSEGAISMLLNDPKFAQNLQLTVKDLDLLLKDIRLHPERYRRILSKKKMPYEAPAEDNN